MKKLLIVLLITLLLSGCGGSKDNNDSSAGNSEQSNNTVDNKTDEKKEEASFEEVTVVDNDYLTFKFTDLDTKNIWGYTLKAFIENKTDKDVTVSVDNVSVDGYMCDPFWATNVAAGKKTNSDISWTNLESSGLSGINNLEFTLRVTDDSSWDTILEENYSVTIDKNAKAPQGVNFSGFNEITVEDNDTLLFKVINVNPDGDWGYTLNVYIENRTDANVYVSWDDVSVNGYMCDPFWSVAVAAGKKAYTTISWFDTTFEENGITEVEDVEFTLRVSSIESWNTYLEGKYTLNLQ